MKQNFISIIVCTYNRDCYIDQCLERIAANEYSSDAFEIVLVDNNSTDSTSAKCKAFESAHPQIEFRYFLETKQGLSYARNRGIEESRGDVLVFLDDDSLIGRNYLSSLSDYLKKYPDAAAFGGKIDPLFESGNAPQWLCKWTYSWVSAIDKGDKVVPFAGGKYPIGANMGFRRKTIESCGLFDTSLGRTGKNMLGGEEKEIFSRISASGGKILYFPGIALQHVIPERRTTREYIVRFARGIGYSEFVRCSRNGWRKLLKRRFSELIKWAATILLWFVYLFSGRKVCGDVLVLFRWNVSQALFFPKSVEI